MKKRKLNYVITPSLDLFSYLERSLHSSLIDEISIDGCRSEFSASLGNNCSQLTSSDSLLTTNYINESTFSACTQLRKSTAITITKEKDSTFFFQNNHYAYNSWPAEQATNNQVAVSQPPDQAGSQSYPYQPTVATADAAASKSTLIETADLHNDAYRNNNMASLPCLAVRVGHLKLAFPIAEINKVYPWRAEVTGQSQAPKYCVGWCQLQKKRHLILDVESVFPSKKITENSQTFNYVFTLQQAPWALVCHELLGVFNLELHKIQWRKKQDYYGILGVEKDSLLTVFSAKRLVSKLEGEVDLDVL